MSVFKRLKQQIKQEDPATTIAALDRVGKGLSFKDAEALFIVAAEADQPKVLALLHRLLPARSEPALQHAIRQSCYHGAERSLAYLVNQAVWLRPDQQYQNLRYLINDGKITAVTLFIDNYDYALSGSRALNYCMDPPLTDDPKHIAITRLIASRTTVKLDDKESVRSLRKFDLDFKTLSTLMGSRDALAAYDKDRNNLLGHEFRHSIIRLR